jgi:outer membrane protein assembly factor BamD
MKQRIITLFAILAFIFIGGCKTSALPDTSQLYKGETEAQIYQAGVKAMLKNDCGEAAQRFEALESRYPFGPYARQAQLNLMYSYYQQNDSLSTLAAADQYLRLYPRGPDADYAYYMKGMAEMNVNRGFFEKYFTIDFAERDLAGLKKAFVDFDRVVRWFPDSKYAADSRLKMIDIRNTIARHILQIGQYYFDQGAYVAAANRGNEIIKVYQQTPSVPDALVLMYKSYQKLGLTKNADETMRVIQLNYPDLKI